jgi:CysZ protein
MIDILLKSVNSLLSRRLIKTSFISLIITFVILALFVGGAWVATLNTEVATYKWLEVVIDFLVNSGAVVLAWFLFPVITPLIASLFVEKVAKEIEREDYTGCLNVTKHKISTTFFEALRFAVFMLFLNILCLPFYFIPFVNVIVYYLLNSYLISREFFDMAAGVYLKPADVKALRRSNRFNIIGLGFLIVIINNIPILNLIGPIISITIMVHMFFKLNFKSV